MTTLRLKRNNEGFSLVELMVSIALGLFVVIGVLSIFATTAKSNHDTLKATRLHQDLRAVMDLMARDIRRAGYWRTAISSVDGGPQNPFRLNDPGKLTGQPEDSCLTYSYDLNGDMNIDSNENHGFRLNTGSVQMAKSDGDCNNGDWERVTDQEASTITGLEFAVNSRLLNVDGASNAAGTIRVREVKIELSGELKDDSSVSRTLTQTVRVQTDLYTPP